MPLSWWESAAELSDLARGTERGRSGTQTYRFGLGFLELDSDDLALNRRFGELFPESLEDAPARTGPRVRCSVRCVDSPAVAAVRFDDPEELDPVEFCLKVFPERNYVPGPPASPGWRTLALGSAPGAPLVAMSGPELLADRRLPWQPLVANIAISRVLRLQRGVVFFHAASSSVDGRGVLLMGPKGCGKTTLSLALASRGHGFLGDEIAGLRVADRQLLPVRRAASIRGGLRAAAVERRLGEGHYALETFPDGSPRIIASVASLFPDSGSGQAPLAAVLFLRGFAPAPRAQEFEFALDHFPLLAPLGSSLWGVHAGRRMVELSRLMRGTRCYHLDSGPPDQTAELIEHLCKEAPL